MAATFVTARLRKHELALIELVRQGHIGLRSESTLKQGKEF